jgi:hypothetical protein
MNCARPIVFGDSGWAHREPPTDCPGLVVAWPPPGAGDGEEDAA